MKQYSKLIKFVLATFMFAGITTSCVEKEQNPYFSENEDGTGNEDGSGFEAKLPDPGMISFFVGEEVIVKGSGFSNSDEIYLRNFDYEYNDDANGDGIYNPINIKAEIKSCTSDKLIFIVPEEVNYEYNILAYINKDGRKIKLGEVIINNNIQFDINYSDMYSYEFSIRNYEKPFNTDAKLYLQYYNTDETTGNIELIGSPIYIEEENIVREDYMIAARYNYGLGKLKVVYELNGERAIIGELEFPEYNFANFYDNNLNFEQEYFIEWGGFKKDDTLFITDYEYDYPLQITRITNDGAYFIISENLKTRLENNKQYTLFMRRGGNMFIIREQVYINI